ncbi:MAG: isocitrate lyase/PEP mutase family protein [Chloroflexi bacterium]|nr:isocitrate lyase/PEP mutase family protein [Chloroflexota bacterium]
MPEKTTTRLKQLFQRPEIFVMGGGYNAFQAKMVETVGYDAFYHSGAWNAMGNFGLPDEGIIGLREMADNAYRIASAVNIPVLSDADTGYGTAVAVHRTTQEFIRAGAAGIHLEDQESPKRTGGVAGLRVISIEEAVGKYRAAVDAKRELDPDFQIVARCDARHAQGGSVEEVIKRFKAYKKAGVDVLYFEQPASLDEVRAVRREVEGPLMANLPFRKPLPSLKEQEEAGLAVCFIWGLTILVANQAAWEFLHEFKERGTQAMNEWWERAQQSERGAFEYVQVVSKEPVRELERKYIPTELQRDYGGAAGRRG